MGESRGTDADGVVQPALGLAVGSETLPARSDGAQRVGTPNPCHRGYGRPGVLLTAPTRVQARRWFQRAADAGCADGLAGLANLAANSDPGQGRRWLEPGPRHASLSPSIFSARFMNDSAPVTTQDVLPWCLTVMAGFP